MNANRQLLDALAEVFFEASSASLSVSCQGVRRTLHVSQGNLIAAESTVKAERFGCLLVAARRLGPEIINEAIVSSKASGRLLGDQLVADGHLTVLQLNQLLELQLHVRFEQSVLMNGSVESTSLRGVQPVGNLSIGRLVLSFFRQTANPTVAEEFALPFMRKQYELHTLDELETKTGMLPDEVELWHGILAQDSKDERHLQPRDGTSLRLVAALTALRIIRK